MQKSVEEEIRKCDEFCRQKIAQLSNLVKCLNQDCENIKQEPYSMKEKSEKEINEMREQLKNTFMQVFLHILMKYLTVPITKFIFYNIFIIILDKGKSYNNSKPFRNIENRKQK